MKKTNQLCQEHITTQTHTQINPSTIYNSNPYHPNHHHQQKLKPPLASQHT